MAQRSSRVRAAALHAVGVPNAQHVDYDFLAILLADLAAIGQPYVAVNVQEESDVEGPSFLGNPFTGTATDTSDVRLTMRDVLLKRADDRVKVLASGGRQYAAKLPFNVAGKTFQFIRGYNWADVRVGAKTLRVINTHLESQTSFYRAGAGAGAARRPGEHTGQDRRGAVRLQLRPGERHDQAGRTRRRTPAPYKLMTGTPVHSSTSGCSSRPSRPVRMTSLSRAARPACREFVNDPDTSTIDHRIDLVLARGADGQALPADQGRTVGVDPANRSATGLWPSDHAGVVLRLRP